MFWYTHLTINGELIIIHLGWTCLVYVGMTTTSIRTNTACQDWKHLLCLTVKLLKYVKPSLLNIKPSNVLFSHQSLIWTLKTSRSAPHVMSAFNQPIRCQQVKPRRTHHRFLREEFIEPIRWQDEIIRIHSAQNIKAAGVCCLC